MDNLIEISTMNQEMNPKRSGQMERFRKRPAQRQGSALQECRSKYRCGADRGFTLTEVLVVALILGILLALISAAIFPALDSAKEFGIYSEAAKLKLAMEQLKSQYGANPPADLSNPSTASSAVYKFVARAFPRYDISQLSTDLTTAGASTAFDPGNALVFWLVGFSGDPSNPFSDHDKRMSGADMSSAFYEFDTDRLGTNSNIVRYFPTLPGGEYDTADASRAFLYFDRSAYSEPYTPPSGTTFNAYKNSGGAYYSPQSFQIIQAGLDGNLGTGTSLSAEDDNIGSFASGTVKDLYDKNN
jgi:prepilin-type N-terminal cleavage/methylation domain-containing protein